MTREQLTQEIQGTLDNLANLGDSPDSAKRSLANGLSRAIDSYIQSAVGERMRLLLSAVVTPTGPLAPSTSFEALTRTR
jgi:hypothetical protein